MREGMEAAGFPCPVCAHDRADVLVLDPPQIVLRCRFCEEVWSVEM